MRKARAVIIAGLVVACVPVSPAGAKADTKHAISGVVTLRGGPPDAQAIAINRGPGCEGWNGDIFAGGPYDQHLGQGLTSDLVEGAQVIVRNANDKIIGIAKLGPGQIHNLVGESYDCDLPFRTPKVPKTSIYGIEVGQGRGPALFNRSELQRESWRATITVPDSVRDR